MSEHTAESDAWTHGRDYCPKCGARDATDECATPSGRDHAARRDFRWGWDSAVSAMLTPPTPATHTEWGLIVITRDGTTLLPEAEVCASREQAEERARQERSFGMTVIVGSREVVEWQPTELDTGVTPPGERRA